MHEAGKRGKRAGRTRGRQIATPSTKKATATTPRVRLPVDDRRAQLLELGVAAFAQHAYDDVSVEGIAKAAGVSRGLLFHYFPSKRHFYVAAIGVMAERMLAETFPAEPVVDPLASLVKGLHAYFAFVERHADLFASLLRAGGEAGAQTVVDATRREIVARMRTYLPPGPHCSESALRASLSAWVRLVEGLALDWLEHGDLSVSDLVQAALRGAAVVPGAQQAFLADYSRSP